MPIYEYRCKNCRRVFEKLVPMSASEVQPCPDCGSSETSRLVSLFSGRVSAGGGC